MTVLALSITAKSSSDFSPEIQKVLGKCVQQAQEDFKNLRKMPKIRVNDVQMIYDGFNGSYSQVITLSVSRTNVKLPILGINYRNLLRLDASYNGLGKIDEIGNETFPSLRLFNLSHNALTSINSFVFGHLKEIEILDLSHNCFVRFHYDHLFLRHENLKRLYLNNNRLHSVQSTMRVPKIMTLDLVDFSNNFLDHFSNFDLQISHLNLRNNSLTQLMVFHASGMTLNAAENLLDHIFAPDGSFKTLNLSDNNFEYLSLLEIDEAKVLDISHNFVVSWVEDIEAYDGANDDWSYEEDYKSIVRKFNDIKIEKLDLSFNRLNHLDALSHFVNVKDLNLQNNSFQNILLNDFVTIFPILQQVNLVNNPLNESCIQTLGAFNRNHSEKFQLRFNYEATTLAPLPPLPILVPLILPPLPVPIFILPTTTQKAPPLTTTPAASTTESTQAVVITSPSTIKNAESTRMIVRTMPPITTTEKAVQSAAMTTNYVITATTYASATTARKNVATTEKSNSVVDDVSSTKLPENSNAPLITFFIVSLAFVVAALTCFTWKKNQGRLIVYRSFDEAANIL